MKKTCLPLLIVLAAALFLFSAGPDNRAHSAVNVTYTDTDANFVSPSQPVYIHGNEMVWIGLDAQKKSQVHYRNLDTGEQKILSDSDTVKTTAVLGGDYAVWLQYEGKTPYMAMFHLRSGELATAKLEPGSYKVVSTDGQYVAYTDETFRNIYVYDMARQSATTVGPGQIPVLAKGRLLYLDSDGSLALYDAATGDRRVLLNKPADGWIDAFTGIAFNGHTAVYLQNLNQGGAQQVRMLKVDDPDPVPLLLYSAPERKTNTQPIHLGERLAVWPQRINGQDHLVVADVETRLSHLFADGPNRQILGIYKEQIVLKDPDGRVIYRSVAMTGEPDPRLFEPLVTAVPYRDPLPPSASMSAYEFKEKGELVAPDGSARLTAYGDPFDSFGDLRLGVERDDQFRLTKALQQGQKFVSMPWRVHFPTPYAGLDLTLRYDAGGLTEEQKNRLGIYRLEDSSWVYMGGLLSGEDEVYATIIKQGVFAVLYFDVPDDSVRDYWISRRIAQYNADLPIRVFLDGNELEFAELPQLKNGSTTVQFRPVFEVLGFAIQWDGSTRTITGTKEGTVIQLQIGNPTAKINGKDVNIPAAPYMHNNHTFVPLRFVGEAAGYKVEWDSNLKAVFLYDPSTEGKLYYPDGTLMYEGQLKNGNMHGKGKLYRPDGTLWYDAQFVDNEVIGWGTIYFQGFSRGRDRTGELGIGQFAYGYPDGYFRYFDDSGYLAYEGTVNMGLFHGYGRYFVENQLIYEGEFQNESYRGYGKYYIGGKLDYEGDFVQNVREGWGRLYSEKGYVMLEGEFRDHFLNGRGIAYYPSGAVRFEGNYVYGSVEGYGKGYYENGDIRVEGEYRRGNLVKGTMYYENGDRYTGEFRNEVPHGEGTLYDKDGNIKHRGKFENGNPVQ